VQLNLKVPPALREEVTEAARLAGVSTNRFCEFGLATYLTFLQEQHPPTPGERRPATARRKA
jgi:hypothetical protein